MADDFTQVVFLSHSSHDKAVVRDIAERRLRVWFDDWQIKPGDNIPAKIEERLDFPQRPPGSLGCWAPCHTATIQTVSSATR